ncbi:DUF1446-domain-containing protein [Mollisia scopiformis]|uniref:DUF1446-domain-containing protein n=1 Tax=Mollisia scopiformis TaxID=149040 RepID=A0A194X7A0_MOLSC|nr:DUF1446-domain-containing protein [Mollisia scopiformis]KUJ15964.1 DUF1446-domain-containing protein [Mollisia scopiformis]
MPSKRNIRIGNVSGATGDHWEAMSRMVENGNVDIVTGDWLSEMNIAWNAITKASDPTLGYEIGFLDQLFQCIDSIVAKGLKVITNAGALNVEALASKVEGLCRERGHGQVVVAHVLGDDITELLKDKEKRRKLDLRHLDHEAQSFEDWDLKDDIQSAVAYIGAWGIVEALDTGADIVICGRVTDASPVIAAAAWWYDWKRGSFDQLAGALVAGLDLIECGPYATGANFSGFKEFLPELVDLGFGIAEIQPDGNFFMTKPEVSNGVVNRFNITGQLLYELQGELYLNPDVTADLSEVKIEDTATNAVYISGMRGLPPPNTTKAMIAATGGYQAETTFYINGLDVAEKAEMIKNQLGHMFKDCNFSKLSIELYGTQAVNPSSQQAGTVFLRIFAQARTKEDIAASKFRKRVYALRMQSYPGYHMNLDFRTMEPKPFMEIFPVTIPSSPLDHRAVVRSKIIRVPQVSDTASYPVLRPSYETKNLQDVSSFGPTVSAPLGSIVHARSGDKANNSNVGFFVRHEDEYSWLQNLLSVDKLKSLFGDDWEGGDTSRRVERCEFPNLLAVHFRILDFLDGGIASSSRVDGLGKGIGEFLRSRFVDIPVKFLERGRI